MIKIFNQVRDLTVKENAEIITAMKYDLLPDGAILLYKRLPADIKQDRTIYWHHPAKDFITDAETYLQSLNVENLKK